MRTEHPSLAPEASASHTDALAITRGDRVYNHGQPPRACARVEGMSQVASLSDEDLVARLRGEVEREGLVRTAKRIGMARETVARILAGVDVRAGTRALLRQQLSI